MNDMIVVGISDQKTAKSPSRLATFALGSCVGISLFDPVTQIGGMAHIMLPDSSMIKDKDGSQRMKFADTGIRDLVAAMSHIGANKSRIIAKIAGGANMFKIIDDSDIGNIGERNIKSVKKTLEELGIPIAAEDVGADFGRTVFFDLDTGMLQIQSLGKNLKEI